MAQSYRARLALAIFEACRGKRHPTNGGEHWNVADRLMPTVMEMWDEAYALGRDDEAASRPMRSQKENK